MAGFGDGVSFHEFCAEVRGAGEVVDVDFEEMFHGLVFGEMVFFVEVEMET